MSEVKYLVEFADWDGYRQQFQVLPAAKVEEGDWKYLLNEWGLKEGDKVWKCEKIGEVEKQLIIKKEGE